jgi:hypothetical protein
MSEEPGAAAGAPAGGEGVLFVVRTGGEEPGGGVTEGLTGVVRESLWEFVFAPLAGPAEFAAGAGFEFTLEDVLPAGAARVAQAGPGKVKQFMGKNAGAFRGAAAEAGMEMNFAAADGGAADGLVTVVAQAVVPDETDWLIARWG